MDNKVYACMGGIESISHSYLSSNYAVYAASTNNYIFIDQESMIVQSKSPYMAALVKGKYQII